MSSEYKFDEIFVSMHKSFKVSIDRIMLNRFVELSGDTNPMHTDNEYARINGFNDKVIHGLLTSSFYSTLVGVHLPGKYCLLNKIDIQFINPVYLGDLLDVFGEVTYMNASYKQIEIKAFITNQKKEKISKANIRVVVFK